MFFLITEILQQKRALYSKKENKEVKFLNLTEMGP